MGKAGRASLVETDVEYFLFIRHVSVYVRLQAGSYGIHLVCRSLLAGEQRMHIISGVFLFAAMAAPTKTYTQPASKNTVAACLQANSCNSLILLGKPCLQVCCVAQQDVRDNVSSVRWMPCRVAGGPGHNLVY